MPIAVPRDDPTTIDALRAGGPLDDARRAFSSASARIEQAQCQRRPPSPIETRRMEYEAVAAIVAALGLEMP